MERREEGGPAAFKIKMKANEKVKREKEEKKNSKSWGEMSTAEFRALRCHESERRAGESERAYLSFDSNCGFFLLRNLLQKAGSVCGT